MATTRTSAGTFGAYVVMDPQKLAELLRGKDGPAARMLITDGEAVKQEAVRTCPVHRPVAGERRERKPGTLKDSIVKRLVEEHGELVMLVGSDRPEALFVHEGTTAHTITARNKPALVFFSAKAGRIIRVPKPNVVDHPGTKRHPWLADSLRVLRH